MLSKLALTVPAEVTEVATAGAWADGEASGVFRAIVLTTPSGELTQAHMIVQLLTLGTDGSPNKIFKTVLVGRIDEKKLPNAFLAVEEDGTENEVTWRVTTYDSNSNADIRRARDHQRQGRSHGQGRAEGEDIRRAAGRSERRIRPPPTNGRRAPHPNPLPHGEGTPFQRLRPDSLSQPLADAAGRRCMLAKASLRGEGQGEGRSPSSAHRLALSGYPRMKSSSSALTSSLSVVHMPCGRPCRP